MGDPEHISKILPRVMNNIHENNKKFLAGEFKKMNSLKSFLIEYWYSKNRNDVDLANAIGVDKSLVSKWINGVTEPPLIRKVQIAKLIGVDSRQIFPDGQTSQNEVISNG